MPREGGKTNGKKAETGDIVPLVTQPMIDYLKKYK